jgi:hypothetical protein
MTQAVEADISAAVRIVRPEPLHAVGHLVPTVAGAVDVGAGTVAVIGSGGVCGCRCGRMSPPCANASPPSCASLCWPQASRAAPNAAGCGTKARAAAIPRRRAKALIGLQSSWVEREFSTAGRGLNIVLGKNSLTAVRCLARNRARSTVVTGRPALGGERCCPDRVIGAPLCFGIYVAEFGLRNWRLRIWRL